MEIKIIAEWAGSVGSEHGVSTRAMSTAVQTEITENPIVETKSKRPHGLWGGIRIGLYSTVSGDRRALCQYESLGSLQSWNLPMRKLGSKRRGLVCLVVDVIFWSVVLDSNEGSDSLNLKTSEDQLVSRIPERDSDTLEVTLAASAKYMVPMRVIFTTRWW